MRLSFIAVSLFLAAALMVNAEDENSRPFTRKPTNAPRMPTDVRGGDRTHPPFNPRTVPPTRAPQPPTDSDVAKPTKPTRKNPPRAQRPNNGRGPTKGPVGPPAPSTSTQPPTLQPTGIGATAFPTNVPTLPPTHAPTLTGATLPPTNPPTLAPTLAPTTPPTLAPTNPPTLPPTSPPTDTGATLPPTSLPTIAPTGFPTIPPTPAPTSPPTTIPPTPLPTVPPTPFPTVPPTLAPTRVPTVPPTSPPTLPPSLQPSLAFAPCNSQDSCPNGKPFTPPDKGFSAACATGAPSFTSPCGSVSVAGIWFTFTPTASCTATVTLTLTGSSQFIPNFYVHTGHVCNSVTCTALSIGSTQGGNTVTWLAVANTDYQVVMVPTAVTTLGPYTAHIACI